MAARPNFTIGGWLKTQFIRRDTIGCRLHRHARCSAAGNASATAVIATMPDPSPATAMSTRCSVANGLIRRNRWPAGK